jgi:hypothetical protein
VLAGGDDSKEKSEQGGDEEEELEQGAAKKQKKKKKRGPKRVRLAVMRSTNSYIDAELRRGGGNDSYADLEDFIECPKGPVLWDT